MAAYVNPELYDIAIGRATNWTDTTGTFTAPCNGVIYINDDGTIQFISYKQDAINEIKEQPFF